MLMIVRGVNIKSMFLDGTVKLSNAASRPWVNACFLNYNDRERSQLGAWIIFSNPVMISGRWYDCWFFKNFIRASECNLVALYLRICKDLNIQYVQNCGKILLPFWWNDPLKTFHLHPALLSFPVVSALMSTFQLSTALLYNTFPLQPSVFSLQNEQGLPRRWTVPL